MALSCLPMLGELKAIKLLREVALNKTDIEKLEGLNKALSEAKSSNKSMYASWVRNSN